MDRAIFTEWLVNLNQNCVREKRKILLLLDNFSCHKVDLELSHVETLMLPPNTTSKCQPLDQGIIQNAKVNYKRALVNFYWGQFQLETNNNKFDEITLLHAIRFFSESWNSVKANTILNCFNHGFPGIHSFDDEFRSQVLEEPELDSDIAHILFPGGFSFADFVGADKNLITGAELDDKLEDQEMQDDNNNELSSNDGSGTIYGEPEETQKPKVSDKDAMGALVPS